MAYQNHKVSLEFKAKFILEHFLKIDKLTIKDKPDLRNSKQGIEVTTCIPQEDLYELYLQEREAVINHNLIQLRTKSYETVTLTNGRIVLSVERILLEQYVKTFQKKLEKLNDGYELFKSNELYIFGNGMELNENVLVYLMFIFNRLTVNFKVRFNKVYLQDYSQLFILNLDDSTFKIVNFSNLDELESLALTEFLKTFSE